MTRKHKMNNFINNFSAYEISFLAENIIILFGIIIFRNEIFSLFSPVIPIALSIITLFLIIVVIIINLMNREKRKTLIVSYRLDRYFIIPINIIKNIFINIINCYLSIIGYYSSKIFFLLLVILVLVAIANIRYYSVLIDVKEEVIRKR